MQMQLQTFSLSPFFVLLFDGEQNGGAIVYELNPKKIARRSAVEFFSLKLFSFRSFCTNARAL